MTALRTLAPFVHEHSLLSAVHNILKMEVKQSLTLHHTRSYIKFSAMEVLVARVLKLLAVLVGDQQVSNREDTTRHVTYKT